ncbi:hypothetical protein TcCL_ESM06981 [Trypanosoma cruzi]|nr:hypothetical protein TcCL_ESM06981 [Trypanosoma cruzi]
MRRKNAVFKEVQAFSTWQQTLLPAGDVNAFFLVFQQPVIEENAVAFFIAKEAAPVSRLQYVHVLQAIVHVERMPVDRFSVAAFVCGPCRIVEGRPSIIFFFCLVCVRVFFFLGGGLFC